MKHVQYTALQSKVGGVKFIDGSSAWMFGTHYSFLALVLDQDVALVLDHDVAFDG